MRMVLNDQYDDWEPGWEGCDTPYDLGWLHGTEDAGSAWTPRPGCQFSSIEFDDYKDGYREARRGWN